MAIPRQRADVFAASRQIRKETGFRSSLELEVTGSLEAQDCRFLYEAVRVPFHEPHVYIPDYCLTDQAIVLEAKGHFTPEDRRKMLLVKKQYPALDIRFIFTRSLTRIGRGAVTTYGMWCEKHGFPYADKVVPPEWVAHKPNQQQKEAFAAILGVKLNNGTA